MDGLFLGVGSIWTCGDEERWGIAFGSWNKFSDFRSNRAYTKLRTVVIVQELFGLQRLISSLLLLGRVSFL